MTTVPNGVEFDSAGVHVSLDFAVIGAQLQLRLDVDGQHIWLPARAFDDAHTEALRLGAFS